VKLEVERMVSCRKVLGAVFGVWLCLPSHFAVAANLFVSDHGPNRIYEIAPDGTKTIFASGLNGPEGLAFDSIGDLFDAEPNARCIYEFTPVGTKSTFATAGIVSAPQRLAFAPSPVPEPSTLALLGVSGIALMGWVWRRRTHWSVPTTTATLTVLLGWTWRQRRLNVRIVAIGLLSMLTLALAATASFAAATITHQTTQMSNSRGRPSVAFVDGKMLVIEGYDDYSTGRASNVVDVYDVHTWQRTATMHSLTAMSSPQATVLGSKVIIAGGNVNIYDDATGSWSSNSLSVARNWMGVTAAGGKAFFAGGGNAGDTTVDVYNATTGLWSVDHLSVGRTSLAATSVGGKALFAGGYSDDRYRIRSDRVDIFDTTTSQWATAHLSQARSHLSATTAGNFALFAGGSYVNGNDPAGSDVVDIYNASTGQWSVTHMPHARTVLAAGSVGDLAYFAGGEYNTYSIGLDYVDIYDTDTGLWSSTTLAAPRSWLGGGSDGHTAVFAGGVNSPNVSNVVDLFSSPVPEPSTLALLGVGALVLLAAARRKRKRAGLALVAILLAVAPLRFCEAAASTDWVVPSGDWSNGANWSAGQPDANTYAGVAHNGTVTISASGTVCAGLEIGWDSVYANSGTGAVVMTGGDFTAPTAYVGFRARGTFTQSGGTVSLTAPASSAYVLLIGGNAPGTYNLSGAATLNATCEELGWGSTGTFNQSGGTNTTSKIIVGSQGTGYYTLSGTGVLSAATEWVGYAGSGGTFTQSGGTNTVSSVLMVDNVLAPAMYTLNSGQLSAPVEEIGYYDDPGVFNQNGGTNSAGRLLLPMGYNRPTVNGAAYNLNGGTLIVTAISQGAKGTALNLNGGTLQAGATFSTNVPMALGTSGGGATFDTAGYAVTLSGSLSGSGSLTKLGSGTLTLSASNSYLGPTTVAAGKLYFDGSLSSSGLVSVGDGATFGGRGIAGSVTVSGGSAGGTIEAGQGGLGALTLTGLTFNGKGTIGVANVGATSPTIINVGSLAAAGPAGSVTINVSGSSLLSGVYRLIGYTGAVGGAGGFNAFKLGATPTPAGPRFSSQLVNNAGEIDLLVSNDYLLWSGAASSEWSTAAIAAPKNWKLFSNSAATDYLETVAYGNDAVAFDDSVGGGAKSINIAVANVKPVNVAFNNSAINYTLQSPGAFGISGTTALTKSGSGTLTVATSNSYSGNTFFKAGTLQIGSASALGSGTLAWSGGTLSSDGAGTRSIANPIALSGNVGLGDAVNNGPLSLTGKISLSASSRLTVNSAATLSSAVSGTGFGITKAGAGVLTLSANNPFTGGVILETGQLNINNYGALGTSAGTFTIADTSTIDNATASAITLTTNNPQAWNADFTFLGTQALNLGTGAVTLGGNRQVTVNASTLTVGGAIGGNYSLTKAGAGALTLSGSNTYSGGTVLAAGRLNIGNAIALGSGGLTIAGSSTLDNTAGIAVTLGNNISQAWNADFTFLGTQALNLGAGAVTLGGNRQVTINASTLTVGGAIGGNYSLTKAGTGTLTLSGSNTYSGGTMLSAGRLNINNPAALSSGTLTISGASTLGDTTSAAITLSNNPPQIWNANLTFAGSQDLNLGTGSVTLGGSRQVTVSSNTLTVGGPIGGNYSLTKSGSGTLLLSGSNTYTGPTTVSQGKLLVDGWLTNSAVGVNSGGTLGGTGSLTSGTISSGGHLSPGDSSTPGIMNLSGNLLLAAGSVMDYDLGGIGDEVSMPSGILSLNLQQFSDFHFTMQAGFGPGIYTLIDANSINGNLGTNKTGVIGSYAATLYTSGGDLMLNVVPEPSTLATLGVGALGLLGYGWRRREARRTAQRELQDDAPSILSFPSHSPRSSSAPGSSTSAIQPGFLALMERQRL